jgi:hypothetical protein
MSLKDAEAWLAERRTQRDEVLQIAEIGGVLWHDADRQALVDESWRVVEIDARGWQNISNPPVHFFPPKGLRGLPPPKRINIGTGIHKLQALVKVTGDAFIMYVSWMFACLWPSDPYTILVLTGEHGTAKTTAAEVARESRS